MSASEKYSRLKRRELVPELMSTRDTALVVSGLGSPTYDMAAAGDCDENMYLWGAMGLAIPTGLGLALAQPDRRVVVITGDGEAMMGIGSFATVAAADPKNLSILVLDNEEFAETGGQVGLTRGLADIEQMARGGGIASSITMTSSNQIEEAREMLFTLPGPNLIVAKIAADEEKRFLPSRNGPYVAERFRLNLGIQN